MVVTIILIYLLIGIIMSSFGLIMLYIKGKDYFDDCNNYISIACALLIFAILWLPMGIYQIIKR